ncbi:MAG: hypothetical protein ACYTF1_12940 [Planctomycetota bacterium]|jgi:hypothetical protein
MLTGKRIVRWSYYLFGGLVVVGVMGGPCELSFIPNDGISNFDIVTVELVNNTEFEVEPNLFVDPQSNIISIEDILIDDNFVDIGIPVQPDEIVQIDFDCPEIGSVVSDFAFLFISDTEQVESDNGPFLIQGEDFLCGDVISFIYIDEFPDGVFFTRVEVNGEFLED